MNKPHPVTLRISACDIEAITVFIRERIELWQAHAELHGVADPLHLPQELARAHAKLVIGRVGK